MFLMPGSRAQPRFQGIKFTVAQPDVTAAQKLQARSNIGMPIGQIPGATTNAVATAGNIGELLTATASAGSVPLTTTTATTVASVSLTAGSWDVTGNVVYTGGSATTVSYADTSISTSSNSEGAQRQTFYAAGATYFGTVNGAGFTVEAPVFRFNSSGGTTAAYLIAFANFGSSNMTAGGTIRATRVF